MTTLTYRGTQFQISNTSINATDLNISGTYRGIKTSFRHSAIARKPLTKLQFMGNSYIT
ncbi:MAG: DUF4278 domain-containing protein [Cyanobacteria bacterium P01_A01_bin.135]